MKVTITWQKHDGDRFVDDGSEIVDVRETPKLLFVRFPSGWVKRVKKFGTCGPRSRTSEHYAYGRRYVLSWSPSDYSFS